MDKSIEQFSRDLALAKYAKTTQARYVKIARQLGSRFGRPVSALGREGSRRTWPRCGFCIARRSETRSVSRSSRFPADIDRFQRS